MKCPQSCRQIDTQTHTDAGATCGPLPGRLNNQSVASPLLEIKPYWLTLGAEPLLSHMRMAADALKCHADDLCVCAMQMSELFSSVVCLSTGSGCRCRGVTVELAWPRRFVSDPVLNPAPSPSSPQNPAPVLSSAPLIPTLLPPHVSITLL